jgi:hypothetical protein
MLPVIIPGLIMLTWIVYHMLIYQLGVLLITEFGHLPEAPPWH